MNPALQNYLQNQQQQQAAPQQQSQPYNPFDSGIQKAIASARQSLGMTANQEEDAFNKGLLAFGDAIAQTPPEKGFWNNLTSAGRALSPGIRAYDEAEAGSLAQNQALANEILKQDALKKQREADAEERQWKKQLAQDQLAEQRRYHDLMYGGMKGLGAGSGQFIPITNKTTQNRYTEDKKKLGQALKQLDDVINDNTKIESTYQQDFLNPTGPFSKVTAPAENLFGVLLNNSRLKEKSAKRDTLNSEFVELKAGLERTLKGEGVLGPKILEYFDKEKVYPSISDTTERRKEQLDKLRKKIADSYDAADLSLKHGVQLDSYNVDQFKNYLNPQQAVPTQTALAPEVPAQGGATPSSDPFSEGVVKIVNLENPKDIREIPKSRLAQILSDPQLRSKWEEVK